MSMFSYSRNPREDPVPSYVLYSPQGSKPLAGLHVEGGAARPCYDKSTKSQLLQITPSARVSFLGGSSCCVGSAGAGTGCSSSNGGGGGGSSSSSTLAVASQRIIILQLYCEKSARIAFSLKVELMLQDKLGRHRIVFSNSFQKKQHCVQHVKVPLHCVLPGMWSNLVFDVPHLHAFLRSDSGGRLSTAELCGSRRLLHMTVSCSSTCCVRRLLGMPELPSVTDEMTGWAEWPLSLRLPPEVPARCWVIRTGEEEFLTASPPNGISAAMPASDKPGSSREKIGVCHTSPAFSSSSGEAPHNTRTERVASRSLPSHSSSVSQATSSGQQDEPSAGLRETWGMGWVEAPQSTKLGLNYDQPMLVAKSSVVGAAVQRQGQEIKGAYGHAPAKMVQVSAMGRPQEPSPRPLQGRHVSVQTNSAVEEGLHVTRASPSGMRTPSNVRQDEVMVMMMAKEDEENKWHHQEETQQQLQQQFSPRRRSTNRGKRSSAVAQSSTSTIAPEETPSIDHADLPTRLWEQGDARLIDAPQIPPAMRSVEAMASKPHATPFVDYQRTLDLMCERVKCIQALINDSECRTRRCNVGENVPCETENFSNSGDRSRVEEDRHGGRPRLHPSPEHHVLENESQTQQQLWEERKPRTPPEFYSHHLHRAPAAPPDSVSPRVEHRSSGNDAPLTFQTDTDSDDDERFTVKVCMSCEKARQAVVVPAESTMLDMRPPVPPTPQRPHPNTHEVNRLCFDSMASELSMQEPRPRWSFCGATTQAEEDTTLLSPPPSPFAAVGGRLARRGRLGEETTAVKSPSHESPPQLAHEATAAGLGLSGLNLPDFPFSATVVNNNTPLQSLHLGRGADEVESSVSTLDYRRSPAAGRTATAAASHRTNFMRLGSARGDDNSEGVLLLESQAASFPHRTPLPQASSLHVSSIASSSRDVNTHVTTYNRDAAGENRDTRVPHAGTPVLPAAQNNVDNDGERQGRENVGTSLLFDPLLQCCLDLRSNTYVMTARHAQKGAV